ncbi:MAG TPA: class I SAM-dependent rRNA methyltransferase [Candidatus Competibacteraceae bacterium]|nr:class I SAM-dependent rRNA methyltransferase [Candidatus Competibacteraceae bacterium]HRZ06964.1 class I SAM-dependent rRNA methyltransferase [Candidatus Competibacteraceae bacterium]HSA47360.1 class I SAM-dependent rRNA methyltransferase [Candidatus Competibacteraceae bacterium]
MSEHPDSPTELAPLRLRKNEDRRLRAGHLWVYSNEVDVEATPLRDFQPGQPVTIQASNGKFIGTGYINPHVLLCARLVSRDSEHPLNASLLVHRLNVALRLRERLYAQPFYRLVHGEGDGLPGLIVDRYGDQYVAQLTTAGMERMKEDVLAALQKVLKPQTVLWRNDSPVREIEGLERYVVDAVGEISETMTVEEDGLRFQVAARTGQKTGWFYDQRDNRARLDRYIRDRRVLDVFSYVGAWGIRVAAHGAREVQCVDSSAPALELAAANAALNGVSDRVQFQQGDAFEVLKALREARQRFDVVIIDPPAFIKRRKDLKEGTLAYRRINEMAMQVLERDGLLVSCSCSQLFPREALQETLLQASRHLDRNLVILEQGRQGPDHPVPPAIPETDYLKAVFARVLPA